MRNAEILFPDDAITYRIVECAVDSTVYENVLINGETVPDERVEIRGNLKSYSSEVGSAENKPSISFDNCVKDDVIKELHILKELQDENGNPIAGTQTDTDENGNIVPTTTAPPRISGYDHGQYDEDGNPIPTLPSDFVLIIE